MAEKTLAYYIERYLEGSLTQEEGTVLAAFLKDPAYAEELNELMDKDWEIWENSDLRFPAVAERVRQAIAEADSSSVVSGRITRRMGFLRKYGWAAAMLGLLALGGFLWVEHKERSKPAMAVVNKEIQPGKTGAVLLLEDGSSVLLDTLEEGRIALQGGAVARLENGVLHYDVTGGAGVFNTMSTPKGRQFQVTLADGTRAWLNAASSIRYPTVFSGNERKVDITGEVYFEVAKNTTMPFRVNVNGRAEVEVLGTHFNVNAYDNEESLSATLLQGSVKINGTVIKPGQQAKIANEPGLRNAPANVSVSAADVEKVMAWKNGLFNFEGLSLEAAMKQLERWYDIEVVYEKEVPAIRFVGEIEKNTTLNGLLNILEKTGVHFRIEEGRRLIVSP